MGACGQRQWLVEEKSKPLGRVHFQKPMMGQVAADTDGQKQGDLARVAGECRGSIQTLQRSNPGRPGRAGIKIGRPGPLC